ncbi:MAG: class I SAM-dependent methyltransferase [Candidatus Thorarchaeota archaeon]
MSTEKKPKTWGGFWDIFGEILVDSLDILEGSKVMDVGPGGGAVLYPVSRIVGDDGRVVGVELCEHCVGATSSEIERCEIKNAEVLFRDACETGFEDDSFDYVTAGFIGWDDYFNFDTYEFIKPDLMMKEITRVLKPARKFGMSTWLRQEDLDWMYQFLTSHSIPSKKNYHIENERGWRKILSTFGYSDVRVFSKSVTYTYDSIDFWWKEMTDYDWTIDDEDQKVFTDALKKSAYEAIQSKVTQEGIPFTRDAIFVIGTSQA